MDTESKILDHTGKPFSYKKRVSIEQTTQEKILLPTTYSLIDILDQFVYSQNSAKEALALGFQNIAHRYSMPDLELPKSNILMIGPTGTGKTYMVDIVSQLTNVPVAKTKMTGLSQEGFYGGSISDVFENLIDLDKSQELDMVYKDFSEYAIIYLDEIDKVARDSIGNGFSKGLQDELIGYIENTNVLEELSTKDMLFIASGAFSGLEEIIKKRIKGDSTIGFNTQNEKKINEKSIFSHVTHEDLVEYGFKPELAARFTNICYLDELDEKDLEKILLMPSSYLNKKKLVLEQFYGIELNLTRGAITEIARYSKMQKTNARSLQSSVDKLLRPVFLNADKNKYAQIRYDKRYVKDFLEKHI